MVTRRNHKACYIEPNPKFCRKYNSRPSSITDRVLIGLDLDDARPW